MKRSLLIAALLSLGAITLGTTANWKAFQAYYNIKEDSNIHAAACTNCHIGKKGGKLNPYGKQLQTVLKAAGTKKLTPALMKQVENMSALGGQTNIARIRADKNPGSE